MPIQKVNIETFLELATQYQLFDVRSPAEYLQAHLLGAYSLPLFTNEERKIVGTAYKQESKQRAIKIALKYFGGKMVSMIEEVENVLKKNSAAVNDGDNNIKEEKDIEPTEDNNKTVLVYCWRGGMRSAGVAWLLDLYGFKVYTLIGGYKSFRQWALKQFDKEYDFKVLGGYTGSGKTEVLHALVAKGERVIDLENLANHKGSAFGNLDLAPQPSQEMFENNLALKLLAVETCNKQRRYSKSRIWLEDESRRIGSVNIPLSIWDQIRSKSIYFLNVPFNERLEYLVRWYGQAEKEKLINAIDRIKKRLGGLETKTASNFLLENNVRESFKILLQYYDKLYLKGLQSREGWESLLTTVECINTDSGLNAIKILEIIEQQND